MNNKQKFIESAKRRYLSGVPFEKVIEEVLENAFINGQFYFFLRMVDNISELDRRQREREKDEKRNN